MATLVFILLVVACSNPENRLTKEEFAVASNWTTDGLVAAVTLMIAIACGKCNMKSYIYVNCCESLTPCKTTNITAEMFNQATWQRVWAAKSIHDMRKGFAGGCLLVFMLMMFFGIMGMIAYANDPEAYDNYEKFACEQQFRFSNRMIMFHPQLTL